MGNSDGEMWALSVLAVCVSMALALASAGCVEPNRPHTKSPLPTCVEFCSRLELIGCPEGDPNPRLGVPCSTWCSTYDYENVMRRQARCVLKANSKEEARQCGLTC